jgi:hypothetical protein
MRNKDVEELNLLRKAAKIADDAYDSVTPKIRAGMTELEVDQMLQDAMRHFGGKPAFCIVAAGPNGAEPHHLSDETLIKDGDILVMDFGCDVEGGYKSDITRVVSVGAASDEAKKVYDKSQTPIGTLADRVRHVVQSAFNGHRILIFSGGPAKSDDNAVFDEARAIRDGGGFGSIIGRNSFQRPKAESMKFLHTVMGIYAGEVQ